MNPGARFLGFSFLHPSRLSIASAHLFICLQSGGTTDRDGWMERSRCARESCFSGKAPGCGDLRCVFLQKGGKRREKKMRTLGDNFLSCLYICFVFFLEAGLGG